MEAQGGLSKFDFENDSVHHLSDEAVSVIFEDNREILWIGIGGGGGAAGGLIKYNRSTGERERFSNIVGRHIQSSIKYYRFHCPGS